MRSWQLSDQLSEVVGYACILGDYVRRFSVSPTCPLLLPFVHIFFFFVSTKHKFLDFFHSISWLIDGTAVNTWDVTVSNLEVNTNTNIVHTSHKVQLQLLQYGKIALSPVVVRSIKVDMLISNKSVLTTYIFSNTFELKRKKWMVSLE